MLDEVKGDLHESQMISFRQQIWQFAVDLLYEFCLHINVTIFMNFTVSCCRILNDYPENKMGIFDEKVLID